jgi:hypothetical protein
MAAVVGLHRDVVSQVFTFCGTQRDCAWAMRVSRAWLAAAEFGGFPSVAEVRVGSSHLMAFSTAWWKLPRLVRLHLRWEADLVPASFNRPGLTELSITNRSIMTTVQFERVIGAMQEVRRFHYADGFNSVNNFVTTHLNHLTESTQAKFLNLVELVVEGQQIHTFMIADILQLTAVVERVHLPGFLLSDDVLRLLGQKSSLYDLGLGSGDEPGLNPTLVANITHLRRLRFGCRHLSAINLLNVNRQTLEQLDFSERDRSNIYPTLPEICGLGQLQRLRLPQIDLTRLSVLKGHCPQLTELELPLGIHQWEMGGVSWRPFIEAVPSLTSLDIGHTYMDDFLHEVGKMTQLKRLVLNVRGLENGRYLGNLVHLEHLALRIWERFDNAPVWDIVERCPKLKTFKVSCEEKEILPRIKALKQEGKTQLEKFGPSLKRI